MEKLTRHANFSAFHDLRSDLKVSEMGCEVKQILRGPSTLCLHVFNLKTGKFRPRDCHHQICHSVFGSMPPLRPPSGKFEQAPSDIDGLDPQILNI